MSFFDRSTSHSPNASPERGTSRERDDPVDPSAKSHRTNIKFWLEAKQRRQRSTGSGSPASIVTTGDEIPRDDRRHDPSYRGRTPVRSRIGTVQSARDNRAPVKPRRERVRSHSADANIPTPRSHGRNARFEPQDSDGDRSDRSIEITPPPPVPRALILQGLREARLKRAKSSAVVDSDSDYEDRSQSRIDNTSTSAKRGRRSKKKSSGGSLPAAKKVRLEPRPFPMRSPSPLSPNVQMPTALNIIQDAIAKRRGRHGSPLYDAQQDNRQRSESNEDSEEASSRTPSLDSDYVRTYFFDDEVEEDDDDMDEYDVNDPFIDDTANYDSDVSMESSGRRRTPSKTRTKRPAPSDRRARSHRSERASSPVKRESTREYRLSSPFNPDSSFHDSRRYGNLDNKKSRDFKSPPETPSKPSRRNKSSDPRSSLHPRGPPGGFRMSTGGQGMITPTGSSKRSSRRTSSKSQSSRKPPIVLEISSDSGPEAYEPSKSVKSEPHPDCHTSLDDTKQPSKPKPRPVPKSQATPAHSSVRESEPNTRHETQDVKIDIASDNKKAVGSSKSSIAERSRKDKGKGKAVIRTPSPTPLVEEDFPSDADLSPYERLQIRQAMRESKRTPRQNDLSNTATPGASSSSSTLPSSSPATSVAPSIKGESTRVTMQELVARARVASGGSEEAAAPAPANPAAAAAASAAADTPSSSSAPPSSLTTGAVPSSSPKTSGAPSIKGESTRVTMQDLVARAHAASAGSEKAAAPALPSPAAAAAVAAAVDPSFARRCVSLPTEDETLFPEIQDVILIPTYQGLVCLKSGRIIPWTDVPGKGFISFSAWADWIPRMNGGIAFAAVTFRESGPFRNPARASPLDVGLRTVPGTNQRFNMYCATNPPVPFIGVSSGWCDRSQLLTTSQNGLPSKFVIMVPHSQEFQRTVGFIRTATGYPELHSQFARNGWQYSTKPQGSRAPTSPGNASAGPKRSAPANMFKAAPGDVTARVATDNFSLSNDATVPIYDARGLDSLDFNAVLPKLAESLPLYTGGEIPYGSFIVVGYTMTIYRANNGNWTLGNNIHWVIVVGTPEND